MLANEHVHVEVDPTDGTLTIEADGVRVTGANRYVDGGDGGDTYNYSPPTVDTVVDRPESVDVEATESGPVRARLVVTARYRLPACAVGDERSCERRGDDDIDVDIRTTLELRTGERFLRVRVELDNRARDHRLRRALPAPRSQSTGRTRSAPSPSCAAASPRKAVPTSTGCPRSCHAASSIAADPGRAAVWASPCCTTGSWSTKCSTTGSEVALTLLRATGYLSRSELDYRPNPAGPLDPLEGPQLQRPLVLEYAVLPHRGDWHDARLADAADDFLVPLEHARGGGAPGASRPPTGSELAVHGAHVTAVIRDAETGALTVRVVNLSIEQVEAHIEVRGTPAVGEVVDLVGRRLRRFTGGVPLRPWEIVTLRLD